MKNYDNNNKKAGKKMPYNKAPKKKTAGRK